MLKPGSDSRPTVIFSSGHLRCSGLCVSNKYEAGATAVHARIVRAYTAIFVTLNLRLLLLVAPSEAALVYQLR